MKKLFIIVTAVSVGMAMAGQVVAQAYADKVKITSTTTPMGEMVISASKVPDRALVNIPPYPDALVFQTRRKGEMKTNGKDCLPYIKLLSADPPEKVFAWYKKKLASYYYQKQGFAGIYTHIFWKEKGEYKMFDIEARLLNVNVGISDGTIHKDDYPQARTMIEVTY